MKLAISRFIVLGAFVASGCSKDSTGDAYQPRQDSAFPSVSYLVGTSSDATIVQADLGDGSLRIGSGPSTRLNVVRSTLDASDLAIGRSLFTESRLAIYRTESLPAPVASQAGAPGHTGTVDELQSAGGAGGEGLLVPALPGLSDLPEAGASGTVNVVVYPTASELSRVSFTFATDRAANAEVSEMLDYFGKVVGKYGP